MKFLILDTETTGKARFDVAADHPLQPRLCSIAAATVDPDGNVIDKVYHLVKPSWPTGSINFFEAFAINGLTIARLEDEGKDIGEVLDDYLRLADGVAGIASYGIKFDQKIMRGELRRNGRPDNYGSAPTCCIMMASAKAMGKKWQKLHFACEELLGKAHPEAHDALADLDMTIELFRELRRRMVIEWKDQVPSR